jgi:phage terminase small subunit
MPELQNPKHEQFAQNIARGLSPAKAYISAGFSPKGASTSASRLLRSASVCSRIAELRQLVCNNTMQRFLELAITERDQRLMAIQDRWDRLREAIVARAAGDYKRMMATGVVCMKLKSVRGRNNVQRVYREYEIDTGVIEALNSVERRAAIETGQEQENINLTGQISAKSIALSKVMSMEELEALELKMRKAMEAEKDAKAIEAPK